MICPDCGVEIVNPHKRQVRCKSCQKKRKIKTSEDCNKRRRYGGIASKSGYVADKKCENCGKIMRSVGRNRKFCDDCALHKKLRSGKESRKKEKAKKAVLKLKGNSMERIAEKAKMASEKGISYGLFVSETMLNQEVKND